MRKKEFSTYRVEMTSPNFGTFRSVDDELYHCENYITFITTDNPKKIYDFIPVQNIKSVINIGIGYTLTTDPKTQKKWYKIQNKSTGEWMQEGGKWTNDSSKGKEWKRSNHASSAITNAYYRKDHGNNFIIMEYCDEGLLRTTVYPNRFK